MTTVAFIGCVQCVVNNVLTFHYRGFIITKLAKINMTALGSWPRQGPW